MEPMTLGSAPSSPASPGVNPNFLPGFLMGDDVQPNSSNPSTSPGRNRTPGNFNKLGMGLTEARGQRRSVYNQSFAESPTPQSPFTAMSEKAGPPKQGLFDQLEQKKKPTTPIMSSTVANFNESLVFNESFSRINDDSYYNKSGINFNDSLVSNRDRLSGRLERIDSHWVTVFGFPPSALTLVFSQMASCGPITDKKVPSQGNWVHIKFNNFSEVSRALSLNGKCINNNLMIGVALYHNKENKENNTSVYTSPMRARSLRHSFISDTNNTVLSPQTLPQKSTGMVTKAMEYMFGW